MLINLYVGNVFDGEEDTKSTNYPGDKDFKDDQFLYVDQPVGNNFELSKGGWSSDEQTEVR